jgi:tRNA uridine 5-carbamoylmethylation protein Kti12
MNLNPKEIEFYKELINSYNKGEHGIQYEIEYKDFKTPLDICIERDSKRENPIGAGVITSTYNKYKDFYNN